MDNNDIDLDAFDAALLACWDDADKKDYEGQEEGQASDEGEAASRHLSSSEANAGPNNWMLNEGQLNSFMLEDEMAYSRTGASVDSRNMPSLQQAQDDWNGASDNAAATRAILSNNSYDSNANGDFKPNATEQTGAQSAVGANADVSTNNNNNNGEMHNINYNELHNMLNLLPSFTHTQHLQESAQNHNYSGNAVNQHSGWQLHPNGIQSSAKCSNLNSNSHNGTNDNSVLPSSAPTLLGNEVHNVLPLAFNALAAGVDVSQFFCSSLDAHAVASLANQCLATNVADNTTQLNNNCTNMIDTEEKQASFNKVSLSSTGISQDPHSFGVPSTKGHTKSKKRNSKSNDGGKNSKKKKNTKGSTNASKPNELPPFRLFDAPIELRQNFMNAQRAFGLPLLNDGNSEHYAMSAAQDYNRDSKEVMNVRLVDARHEEIGTKRMKNAKEQKRAQRITELIDQLRIKMESSGWRSDIKSKLSTLSSCAEYVKHLIKINKNKEETVKTAKCNLEAKRQKMEDDKAQQDPSDPESTTSSLTVSLNGSKDRSSGKGTSTVEDDSNDDKKRAGTTNTKSKKGTHQSSNLTEANLLASACTKSTGRGPEVTGNINIDQTISSVSDFTESIKGSCVGKDESQSRRTPEESEVTETNTINSKAAVISGQSNDMHSESHSDVVVHERKRKSHVYSTDNVGRSFRLDYEEVFVKSNIPQILASSQGKIIAWNDFFTCVTGLRKREVKRLTFFSLVKVSELHKLFEIVATALRMTQDGASGITHDLSRSSPICVPDNDNSQNDNSEMEFSSNVPDSDSVICKKEWFDYKSVTLPCINFKHRIMGEKKEQLYMTVTLMDDKDPRKRCFHCALTNSDGLIEEAIPVSIDYLSLFAHKNTLKK